ncbi:hypothetical protein [Helicobacter burdigaliensis]|uniref:hypothetical protein n=1 Tax=Helicobacter burdigaliensis TaxID=2315334 RepID=UPI000EF72F59|nr:hypothetical protein [Helicobacter burdigaliensis]
MATLQGFIITLSIIAVVCVIVMLLTIISVVKSGDKLTSFEKKILIFVAFVLCLGAMGLYIVSNMEFFRALF